MLTKEEKDILINKIVDYLECGKDISDILLTTPEGQKLYAETYADLKTQSLLEVRSMEEK